MGPGMGHQRMGKLPMTKHWKAVIQLITAGADAAHVAASTSVAAEQSLAKAGKNSVLRHAFWLLTQVPLAAREGNFGQRLRGLGLQVGDAPNLVEIGTAMIEALDEVSRKSGGRRDDLGEIASKSATESLIAIASHNGSSLFGTTYAADEALASLRSLSTSRQFGILARDFFSRLARSFLGYFLSRVIPQHVGANKRFQSIKDHDAFDEALQRHCRETSLIVEQFACDWFSKTNYEGGITPAKAGTFVHVALSKITAELQVRRNAHA